MQPSKYQESIFAFCRGERNYRHVDNSPVSWDAPLPEDYFIDFQGKQHCVVEAVAGSGKTTTIIKALEFVPSLVKLKYNEATMRTESMLCKPDVLFLAFNKHIAEELAQRVPSYVKAATLNSVGYSICRSNNKNVKMDVNKDGNILKTFFDMGKDVERKQCYAIKNQVEKMVSLMKALLGDFTDLPALADKFDVEVPEIEDVDFFKIVQSVYDRSVEIDHILNFDDQIFMPVFKNYKFPQYDWCFGDEAQDWSPVQVELVKRLGQGGHIVAVGDRHQSIYGFRGADPEAIPNIIRSLDAVTLPLSICYRCPDDVIAQARKIVPHIENPVNNPKGKGIVKTVTTQEFVDQVTEDDYVLCRTTAPLVKRCLQQIRMGNKAIVKGRDLGRGLTNLVKSLASNPSCPITMFLESLLAYRTTQIDKLSKLGRETEVQNVEDRCDTLDVLSDDCRSVQDVLDRIDNIFSDSTGEGIIFCTGHRAKGLEANRIWWLRPDQCPHPRSKKAWQIVQEGNLKYVITTRSMRELYYVTKEKGEK